jgi:hypothetical protein
MLTSVGRLLRLGRDVQPPPMESIDDLACFRALDKFQLDAFRCLRRRYSEKSSSPFCQLVALKAANAFAAAYQFRKRHTILVSRPVQLQIDPTNICHMHCPSCLHTANPAWASRFDWPSATLGVDQFDEFCHAFGPFATSIALFRDGEPLLHRRFHDFVIAAKSYLLYTVADSSLSMRIDADALVASGLDRLEAAIDGNTAATYERYRRGGNFDLVIKTFAPSCMLARLKQLTSPGWFGSFSHSNITFTKSKVPAQWRANSVWISSS